MKFNVTSKSQNGHNLMRELGYSPQPNGSYARRVSRAVFPRFHVYIKEDGHDLNISLHLDQKGACYDGQTAHSGEYDGDLLEQEKNRILEKAK